MTDIEINEAVARRLGGERRTLPDAQLEDGTIIRHYPDYCHDIKAAWEIVEKCFRVKFEKLSNDYQCELGDGKNGDEFAYSGSAPMAICLAFLKLMQSEKNIR